MTSTLPKSIALRGPPSSPTYCSGFINHAAADRILAVFRFIWNDPDNCSRCSKCGIDSPVFNLPKELKSFVCKATKDDRFRNRPTKYNQRSEGDGKEAVGRHRYRAGSVTRWFCGRWCAPIGPIIDVEIKLANEAVQFGHLLHLKLKLENINLKKNT